MKVIASAPYLRVSNFMDSLNFYVDVLGFDRPPLWGDPPSFAMPSKDGFVIMLSYEYDKDPRPNGLMEEWDAYFWCEGLDDFLSHLKRHGAKFIHEIEERPYYGVRELAVADPDGHMIVFAEGMEKFNVSSPGH
tara:strand:- start:220 stop:621 length:402 start_codon:yes stop_codon:yes gene_type:complete